MSTHKKKYSRPATSRTRSKSIEVYGTEFLLYAAGVLLVTTIAWSSFAARIHQSNSDQLVNSYLFENLRTFQNADFPGAHTFLLKWPIFLIIRLLGATPFAMQFATISLSVATVGIFAYLLYRIERRKLIAAPLLLLLASSLLLVPAAPYAGGILPVNIAMLATRNLEYIWFIGCLYLIVCVSRIHTWRTVVVSVLLGLLFVTDKLFVSLSVGGALIGLAFAILLRKRQVIRLFATWALVNFTAIALAWIAAYLINASGLTAISHGASASPYKLTLIPKDIILGLTYGVLGIFTIFGANPAFDATTLRAIPVNAWERLTSSYGLVYVINAVTLGLVLVSGFWLLRDFFRRKNTTFSRSAQLSVMLIASSVAALAAFVVTHHYYAVDARYLMIVFFAGFTTLATFLRSRKAPSLDGAHLLALIMTCVALLGLFGAGRIYRQQKAALQDIDNRNALVNKILAGRPVSVLAGDYWRVFPIKQQSAHGAQKVLPIEGCGTLRGTLSSKEWQPDLDKQSFAFILSRDKSLTDFPACTMDGIIAKYGRPNASTLIAGKYDNPKELLLFYEKGAHKSAPIVILPKPTTILPIDLKLLPYTSCTSKHTIMNIVAHEDDDLLFMNPDVVRAMNSGNCVRTVYVTAGDAGAGELYWLSREKGSEEAYSTLLGNTAIWVQRVVRLEPDVYVTVVNPQGNPNISLIFLRLPDGNLNGQGFHKSRFESLRHINNGSAAVIRSVDGQSKFSKDQLTATLTLLMDQYQPVEVKTQAPYSANFAYPDHSDHIETGKLAQQAFEKYSKRSTAVIRYYAGYPIRALPENVSGDDLSIKTDAFLGYARNDKSVCATVERCRNTPTYNAYLRRQYVVPGN